MTSRPVLAIAVAHACVTLALAQAPARDLLRASGPGAYAVRYLADRALICTSTKVAVELRVYLPQKPLWGYLGAERQPADALGWDADASALVLQLPAGQHDLEVGWAGTGERPQQGQAISVLVDGTKVADLTARFALDKMTAQGGVGLPVGLARVRLAAPSLPEGIRLTVNIGDQTASEWQPVEGGLESREALTIGGDSAIGLTATGYNLLTSPITEISLTLVARPTDAVRVEAMPTDGILIEAENFTGQGEGTVSISEGKHVDQHGGKSLYNYGTGRHWLEWTVEVQAAGRYDLFARTASAETPALRELTVDGKLPAPAFGMVRFPVTGGWGYAVSEWWPLQVAGGSEALPALDLSAGKHTFRLQSIGGTHLNVDYFVLKPR